ncbi:efflux RND transporter periplasmic adaptor subunit [Vibrio misgurnus]|uniref:efflux RND transporter periplasmic adaptor subunit n=1 Tax=Vibrio misgurnus TaxID=2993714 RepID=UPI002417212A|nr:efflux RND transporter periplasmic adaptor subunit [Vibrio sp. gvc]
MKKHTVKFAITLVAIGAMLAVLAWNGRQMTPITEPQLADPSEPAAKLAQVAVQTTSPGSYQAEIIGYGEAKPRYDLTFSSEVSGRVHYLAENFATGRVIKQGTVIAKLDDSSYQQALSQAMADVTSTHLALLEEQRQGEQAKSEWQHSGLTGEPDSPLVLRQPQLESAQAAYAYAQQSLLTAQKNLANTVIRAPFDALVVSREIQLGSYLNVDSSIATLYSIDQLEIEIPLADQHWKNLPPIGADEPWLITLRDSTTEHQWQARVERQTQHSSANTRQRSLIAVVERPLEQATPLYPGTFVQAIITSEKMDPLWELPASALSQQGDIWTLDAQGTLQKFAATLRFAQRDKIYVVPPQTQASSQVQVVIRPLSHFQVGMSVQPSEAR